MKTVRAVLGLSILALVMCLTLPSITYSQQKAASGVTTQQSKGEVAKSAVLSDLKAARDSGAAAGARESTSGAIASSVIYSSVLPGLGLLNLIGLDKESAKARVDNMSYLDDHTPAYGRAYATGFDSTLIPRYKKTVYVSTVAGSVLGAFFLSTVLSH